jgi:hypothetical protein
MNSPTEYPNIAKISSKKTIAGILGHQSDPMDHANRVYPAMIKERIRLGQRILRVTSPYPPRYFDKTVP